MPLQEGYPINATLLSRAEQYQNTTGPNEIFESILDLFQEVLICVERYHEHVEGKAVPTGPAQRTNEFLVAKPVKCAPVMQTTVNYPDPWFPLEP
jgi:hypothetical protein